MIPEIQRIINSIGTKTNIGGKDIINQLTGASQLIENSIDSGSLTTIKGGKLHRVDEIKPYDILYISVLGGTPHYLLVHKVDVDNDKAYCLMVTSTKKDYLILHEIEGDRIFKGNYFSNTYFCIPLKEAKVSFVRVYEDKREAVKVFNKLNRYYKTLFQIKINLFLFCSINSFTYLCIGFKTNN